MTVEVKAEFRLVPHKGKAGEDEKPPVVISEIKARPAKRKKE
jgi:hypothetical protein